MEMLSVNVVAVAFKRAGRVNLKRSTCVRTVGTSALPRGGCQFDFN